MNTSKVEGAWLCVNPIVPQSPPLPWLGDLDLQSKYQQTHNPCEISDPIKYPSFGHDSDTTL